LQRPPRIEYIEMPEALRSKYQYFTQANIAKLRASGYTAKVSPLDEAVTDYVRNYLVAGRKLGDESGQINHLTKSHQGVKARPSRS